MKSRTLLAKYTSGDESDWSVYLIENRSNETVGIGAYLAPKCTVHLND